MNIRISLYLLIACTSTFAHGRVGFHCHSYPNTPVQVYQYGSSNCGNIDSVEMAKTIGEAGEKDIVCMYQAGCKTVELSEADKEPEPMTTIEVGNALKEKILRPSIVICKGTGRYGEDGALESTICGSPTKCRGDLFYSYGAKQVSPDIPKGILLPGEKKLPGSN